MFQQIDANKRNSLLLVVLVTALLLVVGWAIGAYSGAPWYVGVSVALGVAAVSGTISYFGGSRIVLGLSGARKIQKADHPRLFNVVEEMSIAAGLPMPEVYIIEDASPNAFATGRKPEEAAIAVTRGLLDKLNRDELQGVVAHEMAHIRNYDILLMTMMAVLVGTIALLCDAFLRGTRYSRGRFRSRGRSSGAGIIALLALVLAILAPIIGKLIQLAASRQREYLADASGALLTRYPAGLASALRKIAADPDPLEAANRATQHMYIVNPLEAMQRRAQSLLSTHPAIEDRIARLERMAYMDSSEEPRFPRAASAAVPTPAAEPTSAVTAGGALPGSVIAAGTLAAGAGVAAASAGGAPAADGACPRCSESLSRAKLRGREMQVCKSCGGVWIGSDELNHLLKTVPQRLVDADTKFPNLIGVGWNRVAPKRCPQCGKKLAAASVREAAGVAVDCCLDCDGVWFDDGELAAVAVAAKSRQTAPRQ
ncbi:MAG: M48 family metalloprotease [Armatimonadota bacterium]